MTEVQKELIRSMRLQGIGYRAIARSLHLKLNKVEFYCKTHGLGGEGWLVRKNYPVWCEQNDCCPVCGRKCRTAWCRAKRAEEEIGVSDG